MAIFNSLTEKIKPLRYGMEVIPSYDEDGSEIYVLYDTLGYSKHQILLRDESLLVLTFFDGKHSVQNIAETLPLHDENAVSENVLLEFVQQLDEALFFQNENFQNFKKNFEENFLQATIRNPACAGNSYSENATELTNFLNVLFSDDKTQADVKSPSGILVPHIDLRIGAKTYVPAYKKLENSEAETFVILGTSHYGYNDLFVPTSKHFLTPLGLAETDTELAKMLQENYNFPSEFGDLPHRQEHSIEFQVVFLQHLFKKRHFKILPVLCTSFYDFIENETLPNKDENFRSFVKALNQSIKKLGRKVTFIVSADLSHVGKKFGDDFPAEQVLEKIREEDQNLLDSVVACDSEKFFTKISEVKDCNKVCGLSPIYSFLEIVKPEKAEILAYRQWNETARESAVTFASAVFY
ncbi:AmmeMemoRadiSam system protein B [bacterium]|nr:AmmeMemoRadiSam system protein B [bacterium]